MPLHVMPVRTLSSCLLTLGGVSAKPSVSATDSAWEKVCDHVRKFSRAPACVHISDGSIKFGTYLQAIRIVVCANDGVIVVTYWPRFLRLSVHKTSGESRSKL